MMSFFANSAIEFYLKDLLFLGEITFRE